MLNQEDMKVGQPVAVFYNGPMNYRDPVRANIPAFDLQTEPWISGRVEKEPGNSGVIGVFGTDVRCYARCLDGLWVPQEDPYIFALPTEFLVTQKPEGELETELLKSPDFETRKECILGITLDYESIVRNHLDA